MRTNSGRLIAYSTPKSPISEAYRTLRTNIQFAGINKELRSLMVSSSGPGEGKSTTISNLAVVFAQSGKSVLLLDGDLRKPTIHKIFGLSNRKGLTNVLIGDSQIEDVIQVVEGIGIDVVCTGAIPPNPAELLGSQRMNELLQQLKRRYDLILIDSPPILAVTDAQLLSQYVDGVLLVLSAGKVRRDHAKRAKSLLDHVGAHVIGTVLNNKKIANDNYYYYYGEDEKGSV